MSDLATLTRDHYQAAVTDDSDLLSRVSTIVDALGQPPRAADLASLDQFHVGGLAATKAFADFIGIERGSFVLDAGCGLGGPARYIAETFTCDVVGVDLTPSYVAVANLLSERTGLADRVSAIVGDLTHLTLEDATFDLVWTQHVAMNIADRAALYSGLRRVLKPGGRLAFYDALAVHAEAVILYPTPWADNASVSTVLTEQETRAVLAGASFAVTNWNDVTLQAGGWLAQPPAVSLPGGGPGLGVGPRFGAMVGNFARNLAEGRLRLVMAVCEAV